MLSNKSQKHANESGYWFDRNRISFLETWSNKWGEQYIETHEYYAINERKCWIGYWISLLINMIHPFESVRTPFTAFNMHLFYENDCHSINIRLIMESKWSISLTLPLSCYLSHHNWHENKNCEQTLSTSYSLTGQCALYCAYKSQFFFCCCFLVALKRVCWRFCDVI